MKATPSVLPSTQGSSCPRVAILMCTFNGDRFLEEQLDSIFNQGHQNFRLYISDDGSTDQTMDILLRYKSLYSEKLVEIRQGPQRGYSDNFLSLVLDPTLEADYFAYCDQDDIWKPEKLQRALGRLTDCEVEQPALYCARTQLIDEVGCEIGMAPLFSRPPAFPNALLQNIGGGNTMVFNRAARDLLRKAGAVDMVTHDWWTYILVSAASGRVIYDPIPCLDYRQHRGNLIGSNGGIVARVQRYWKGLAGRQRDWNTRHLRTLSSIENLLSNESRGVLKEFRSAREKTLLRRLVGIRKSGVYYQTLSGNIALYGAALINRI